MRSQTALFYLRSPHYDKTSKKFDYQKVKKIEILKFNKKEVEMKRNLKRPIQANKFESGIYDKIPNEENYA